MSTHEEDRPDTKSRKNVEWVEAIVKWTRYDYVAAYDYPTLSNSEAVMEIYKGDMVQLSRRYRREDWCLCQVGHVLGWVFLKDVRFIAQGGTPRPLDKRPQYETQSIYISNYQEEETATPAPHSQQSKYEMRTETAVRMTEIVTDVSEVETAPAPVREPAVAAVGKSTRKPMINRLINFFKR